MIWRARTRPTPGMRLQERGDAHLADDVVGLAGGDDLAEGHSGVLQTVLDLGALASGGRCLLESRGALFGGERRKCHRKSPSSTCRRWLLNTRLYAVDSIATARPPRPRNGSSSARRPRSGACERVCAQPPKAAVRSSAARRAASRSATARDPRRAPRGCSFRAPAAAPTRRSHAAPRPCRPVRPGPVRLVGERDQAADRGAEPSRRHRRRTRSGANSPRTSLCACADLLSRAADAVERRYQLYVIAPVRSRRRCTATPGRRTPCHACSTPAVRRSTGTTRRSRTPPARCRCRSSSVRWSRAGAAVKLVEEADREKVHFHVGRSTPCRRRSRRVRARGRPHAQACVGARRKFGRRGGSRSRAA